MISRVAIRMQVAQVNKSQVHLIDRDNDVKDAIVYLSSNAEQRWTVDWVRSSSDIFRPIIAPGKHLVVGIFNDK